MRGWDRRLARMNAAPGYHSGFFGTAPSRTGLRIRNDEVVGSSPTSSTNFLNGLPTFGALSGIAQVALLDRTSSTRKPNHR